jgi:hypothetical protein
MMMVKNDFLVKSISFLYLFGLGICLQRRFFYPTHVLSMQKLACFVHLGEAYPTLSLPGSKTMFQLDQYDDFYTPAVDSTYGDNIPTDEQYRSMATYFADPRNSKYTIDEPENYDKHIGVKHFLDEDTTNGGNLATVTKRVVDKHGRPADTAHKNLAFDTR